jgi:hypothetical protein
MGLRYVHNGISADKGTRRKSFAVHVLRMKFDWKVSTVCVKHQWSMYEGEVLFDNPYTVLYVSTTRRLCCPVNHHIRLAIGSCRLCHLSSAGPVPMGTTQEGSCMHTYSNCLSRRLARERHLRSLHQVTFQMKANQALV